MHSELRDSIFILFQKGNIAKAEILLRAHLERESNDHEAFYLLGKMATAINLPHYALNYFNESLRLAPKWQLSLDARDQVIKHLTESQGQSVIDQPKSEQAEQNEKFILIKAWGQGFWSDVSHVLAQLLVAELTGRTPVVHWGTNSLFGDGTSANAFEFYFETFSKVNVIGLQKEEFDIWPPKWT
jgi:protein O-GlcNAc transferase